MRIYSFLFAVALLYGCFSNSCQNKVDHKVNVIAHRGGIVPGYPENTLKAFQRCIDLEVDYIELDLRVTSDGKLVIIHDETLDRTTNGSGRISHYSLEELKAFDAGDGERIPAFDEALRLVSGAGVKLLLDIKLDKNLDAAKVLKAVNEFDLKSMVIFGIRSLEDLAKFHEIDPDIVTLGFISEQDQIDDFIEHGIDIIRLKQNWITEYPELVALLRKQNITVWTTVSIMSDKALKAIINTGLHGIIYDDPDQLQKLL